MIEAICEWFAARAKTHQSIRPDGQPYIERYTFGHGIFLHQYLGSDGDRFLHNHPWRWSVGIPLVGWYKEDRLVHADPFRGVCTKVRHIFRFRPNLIMSTDFHRISATRPGTWTLFIHGERLGGWGYMHTVAEYTGMHRIWVEQHDAYVQEYTRVKLEDAQGSVTR